MFFARCFFFLLLLQLFEMMEKNVWLRRNEKKNGMKSANIYITNQPTMNRNEWKNTCDSIKNAHTHTQARDEHMKLVIFQVEHAFISYMENVQSDVNIPIVCVLNVSISFKRQTWQLNWFYVALVSLSMSTQTFTAGNPKWSFSGWNFFSSIFFDEFHASTAKLMSS